MKYILFYTTLILTTLLISCGGHSNEQKNEGGNNQSNMNSGTSAYDPNRGEGKFDETNLRLVDHINDEMAKKGESISGVKCSSCHKYSDERLVGPGWKGVTARRKPSWIMNFITNPDPMIEKDPQVQAQLEICLIRMPNQNLNEEEAREVLEFMRKNDIVK